jgi:histidinol-phosphate aminotransferase
VPYDAKDVRAEVLLASNENPMNLPQEIVKKLSERLSQFQFNRYPDPTASALRRLLAEANGLEPENVLVGNGGDELIFDLLLAWGGPGRTMLDLPPTFGMYAIDAATTGTSVVSIPRLEDFSVNQDAVLQRVRQGDIDLVMIANPNNPTGGLIDESFLIDLLGASDAIVLVDEAYFEFSRLTMRHHMSRHPNLVLLRTFSKAFSLAGLRVGYLLGDADVICELMKVRQPYSVDAFSQWVAATVYRERVMFEQVISDIIRNRDMISRELAQVPGVEVFPSEANFVLFRVEHASALWRDMLHTHSVLIRDFTRTPGLENCLRVTVGTAEESVRFLEGVAEVIGGRRSAAELAGTGGARGRGVE